MRLLLFFWFVFIGWYAGAQVRVACLGNSITYGAGIEGRDSLSYPAQLGEMLGDRWQVVNYGVSGSTLLKKGNKPYYKQAAFDQALRFKPDIVVLKLGTNDTKPFNICYGDELEKDLEWMVDTLLSLSSKPEVILCLPVPSFAIQWGINDQQLVDRVIPAVRNVAQRKKLRVIDLYSPFKDKEAMFPDLVHPNAEGARLLAEIIAQEIPKVRKAPKIPLYKQASQPIDVRVKDLLARMTIEEKAGQLNQINAGDLTGPQSISEPDNARVKMVRDGMVGSFLNLTGTSDTKAIQKIAVEQTRLGIPLLFALDVIHGYKTLFPIPLAEACSWDLDLIKRTHEVAAAEASAAGIHWTFAPMCDISNDPRWGRVMEGAGEDPYLASLITRQRVEGFQGNLTGGRNIMACIKHFAAYGAVEAGREYNHVDVSRHDLWLKYLPPYEAGVNAGAATVMNAFNVVDGIPASANHYLITDVLKKKWGFKGFLVSDWDSFSEMIPHGYAHDKKDALAKALLAGSMMDMQSRSILFLPELVREKKISIKQVDEAVAKVLYYKFKLGLFDKPYLYCNGDREKNELGSTENRTVAREMAAKSALLLKNNGALPLNGDENVALIGYYAKSKEDMFDFWQAKGDCQQAISLYDGMRQVFPNLVYHAGYNRELTVDQQLIDEAVNIASAADKIVVCVGLSGSLAGEFRSLANLKIPQVQLELIRNLRQLGKPIIAVVNSGRPLVLTQMIDEVDAILYSWILGSETGTALADVLTAKINPSAKTVMSFPYDEGQIPVYYNAYNTGRPYIPGNEKGWVSRFRDIPNEPLFPFGYGLSYTNFEYSDFKVNKSVFDKGQSLVASVRVKNTGDYDGEEIVQLYIHDPVASVVRPVKELKAFEKVFLKKGEEKEIVFTLKEADFGFHNPKGDFLVEAGRFTVMVGPNSKDLQNLDVEMLDPQNK